MGLLLVVLKYSRLFLNSSLLQLRIDVLLIMEAVNSSAGLIRGMMSDAAVESVISWLATG